MNGDFNTKTRQVADALLEHVKRVASCQDTAALLIKSTTGLGKTRHAAHAAVEAVRQGVAVCYVVSNHTLADEVQEHMQTAGGTPWRYYGRAASPDQH
jgi:superfamily II DNA or RNA helicase